MRCVVCQKWSLLIICKSCEQRFLQIQPNIRLIEDFKVYSFYCYEDIGFLLHAKYHAFGSRIYHLLAKRAGAYFFHSIQRKPLKGVYGVGIDDRIKHAYSHTGILLHHFRASIKPIYGELIAKNKVSYAGESLEFRQKNPKKFCFSHEGLEWVIFDDVITTGTSMLEARQVIKQKGGNPLFGIVLSDART